MNREGVAFRLERRAIVVALAGQVWSYRCNDFNKGCSLRRPGPAYLDFMASTPVDPSVIDAMTDAMMMTTRLIVFPTA